MNSDSILGFILMANKPANPISIAISSLSCIILNWFVTLQDLYSFFCFLLQCLSHLLIKPKNVGGTVVSISKPCINGDVKNATLIKGDIEIVMEKLGIFWESSGDDELQERLGLSEFSTLFDESEPSLEEVKGAFDLFDDNKDGYIDANDLKKILCGLGYVEFAELECQKMIMAFSSNGDGRIDFGKFVDIIEDCN